MVASEDSERVFLSICEGVHTPAKAMTLKSAVSSMWAGRLETMALTKKFLPFWATFILESTNELSQSPTQKAVSDPATILKVVEKRVAARPEEKLIRKTTVPITITMARLMNLMKSIRKMTVLTTMVTVRWMRTVKPIRRMMELIMTATVRWMRWSQG